MPVISGGTILSGDGFPAFALTGAGAPAANFGAGTVRVGSLYVNTTSGSLYACTATNGSTTATWTAVGAQTAGS